MAESNCKKGYLTCEDNEISRGKLLRDTVRTCYTIKVNEKTYFSRFRLNKTIYEHLKTNLNAVISPVEVIEEKGKEYIFDIPGTRSRTLTIDGVKKIRVRVVADNVGSLVTKMGQIKEVMRACGEYEKECMWEKEGNLELDINKIEKYTPEFDMAGMKKQKMLELQTFRQN